MDNFSKDVMQLIQAKLGNEVTVNLEHIVKVNDMHLTAVAIRKKDDNTGINFYIDSYYESYKRGCSLEKIVEHLVEQYYSEKVL